MAEYIEREAVIDLITRRYECPEICTAEINSIPAADVVEVVRCRDCKHWEEHCNGKAGICKGKMKGVVKPDDFCAYGDRRCDDG
jgi:hypothetical protein